MRPHSDNTEKWLVILDYAMIIAFIIVALAFFGTMAGFVVRAF